MTCGDCNGLRRLATTCGDLQRLAATLSPACGVPFAAFDPQKTKKHRRSVRKSRIFKENLACFFKKW